MEDREPTLSTGSRGQRPWRMQPSTNQLVGSIVPSKTDRSFLTFAGKAAIQLTLTRSWGRGRKPVSARRDHEKEKIKVAREIPFSNA